MVFNLLDEKQEMEMNLIETFFRLFQEWQTSTIKKYNYLNINKEKDLQQAMKDLRIKELVR